MRIAIAVVGVVLATLAITGAEPALAAGPPRASAPAPGRAASIEGIVRDKSGAPVVGALVAAVPENSGIDEVSTRPAALVRSGRGGRFRLGPIPAGAYSITATRRGLAAAYVGGKSLPRGQTLRAVELRFDSGGITLRGRVADRSGEPLPGAQIRAMRYSDFLGDIFYAEADSAGTYEITLPPARYYVCASVPDHDFIGINTASTGDATTDLVLDRTIPTGPPPPAVIDWIRAHAVPIRTVEAGHGFEDLEPLRETIGGARVVALGEATHGTREFFQLKHRMLEFLVARMGFDVFAIEANMPEGFDVNDYVLTGRGDPEKALAGLYFWTWDTEEVLDLIRWMRRWNNDPSHPRKVKFYAIDMQFPTRAAKNVLEFLRKLDLGAADSAETVLHPFADPYLERRWLGAPGARPPIPAGVDSTLRALAARFEEQRLRDRMRTGERAFLFARQNVRIVQQWLELVSSDGFEARDRAMAENVQWILDRAEPGSKIVLWAHNAHVSMAARSAGGAGMGHSLHAALGPDMVVFGFAFDRGGFQAIDATPGVGTRLASFRVGPARSGSLDDALSKAGAPIAAVDVRRLPQDGEVADWFSRPHWTRTIGATYADTFTERYYGRLVPAEAFDALLFVDSTSAARSNPRGFRSRTASKPAPGNLDFERGVIGEAPPDWSGPVSLAAASYRAEIRRDDARSGSLCGTLRRLGGRTYGETYGTLEQVIDATPFRGRRIRFSARVRVESGSKDDEAFLQLRDPAAPGTSSFSTSMEQSPITSRGWRGYAIEADIPATATTLAFGLVFVGQGTAWIDNANLETIESKSP